MTGEPPIGKYDPDVVLEAAAGKFQRLVIFGVDAAGKDVFMCSHLDPETIFFDLGRAENAMWESGDTA